MNLSARIGACWFAGVLGLGLTEIASAQTPSPQHVDREQRMSAWLRAHPQASSGYLLGLMWRTPEELARQTDEQAALRAIPDLPPAVRAVIEKLAPTGRVALPAADADWLEAYPQRDPLLKPGDSVEVPGRPASLRVVTDEGFACELSHHPGALALDYLRLCLPSVDGAWAWVIQPDGRVQRVGLTLWNPSIQNEPAPGAWIWAPAGSSSRPPAWQERVATWFATQGASARMPLDAFARVADKTAGLPFAPASIDTLARQYSPTYSFNNFGMVGLMQTPTARMQPAGGFGLTVHRTWPYRWFNFMVQPLDWLETGFRYTSVSNRRYSPYPEWSGEQPYLDKSIDAKVRLWRESPWVPELAVGIRDVGGTGLFSSEYVVASKRTGRVDWSLGLAWGHLGGRADLGNPLASLFGSRFNERAVDFGLGGKFGTSTWFRGRTALFGGLEVQTPWQVALKIEVDGNNYRSEPLGNAFEQKSPMNIGVVYRPTHWVDISAGLERGNTWSAGITFHTDLASLNMPKITAPRPPAVRAERPLTSPDWQKSADEIERLTLWDVRQISVTRNVVAVEAAQSAHPYASDRLDKAMAVLHRDAPASIDTMQIRHRAAGDVLATEEVNRDEWVRRQTEPPRNQATRAPFPVSYRLEPDASEAPQTKPKSTRFRAEPGLDLVQTTGGPDGYLYQLEANLRLSLDMPANVRASGILSARIVDNYDNFKDSGWSYMTRVRTYQKQFLTTSRTTMGDLSVSKVDRLADNWFWSGYAGYFEQMYGGWGTEVLYRQPRARWAIGADINKVRMRDFHQDFRFQDYRATTGHVTLYWETPWQNIVTSLAAGQYLAGDRGATWSISKVFENGTTLTGYVTRTNVPAEVFGEGSFDKGIALKIPFDAFLTSPSRYSGGWSWKPLVRDGGAIVSRPVSLYGETTWLSPSARSRRIAPDSNDRLAPDDHVEPYERRR